MAKKSKYSDKLPLLIGAVVVVVIIVVLFSSSGGLTAKFMAASGIQGGNENNQDFCNDRQDNDGDNLVDAMDPDCWNGEVCFRTIPIYQELLQTVIINDAAESGQPLRYWYCPPHNIFADPCGGYLTQNPGSGIGLACVYGMESANPLCTECNEECKLPEPGDGTEDWTCIGPTPDVEAEVCGALCGM